MIIGMTTPDATYRLTVTVSLSTVKQFTSGIATLSRIPGNSAQCISTYFASVLSGIRQRFLVPCDGSVDEIGWRHAQRAKIERIQWRLFI